MKEDSTAGTTIKPWRVLDNFPKADVSNAIAYRSDIVLVVTVWQVDLIQCQGSATEPPS